MDQPIDITNKFLVGAQVDRIIIMKPVQVLTNDEALNLAAWLVALADLDNRFPAILKAIQNA
jgi:hypothetical protein